MIPNSAHLIAASSLRAFALVLLSPHPLPDSDVLANGLKVYRGCEVQPLKIENEKGILLIAGRSTTTIKR